MISVLVNEIDVMGGTHKQVLRLLQYLKDTGEEYEVLTKYYDIEKTYPGFADHQVKFVAAARTRTNMVMGLVQDLFIQAKVFAMLGRRSRIVNVHDNGFPLVILLSRLTGKKVFWQINDLPWVFSAGNAWVVKLDALKRLHASVATRFYRGVVAKCVDQITVNVNKNRDRVREKLNRDALVLHCGVDQWSGDVPARAGFGSTVRILSSGVFFPYRNYETLVAVVRTLNQKGFSAELDIIGSTELDKAYSQKIIELIQDQGLAESVRVHGQVSQETYRQLHESADLFVFINIDQSWGLAVFEAMGSGLPVVVSESVGATEILDDDVNAIFVRPTDVEQIVKKISALNDFETYSRIARAGSKHVEELTWDNIYSSKLVQMMKEAQK